MNKQQTITIAGVEYDAHTGMRLDTASPANPEKDQKEAKATPKPSHALHVRQQRSATLKRAHVSAPARKTPVRPHSSAIHKSPMIRKFAAMDVVAASQKKQPVTAGKPDVAPVRHPLQEVAATKVATRHSVQAAQPKPAYVIKQEAIAEALEKATPARPVKQSFFKRHPRIFSVGSAAIAVVVLAGYLTYVNLPGLSVRVAAAQAGINATMPSYHPVGYSLNGPVAYSAGTVTMDYAANASSNKFTLTQSKSTWDSDALLQNLVIKTAGDDYATYNDDGLTLYVYGNNAAWVNGGILHVIQSTATLSNEQLRKIATSM